MAKRKAGNPSTTEPPDAKAAGSAGPLSGEAASRFIDERIESLGGWRGETLARMRALILTSGVEVAEEVKWMGTPVWSHQGILCTGEAYKAVVKLTFARGATIPDPAGLFNSSLEGNTRRAIDLHEGETIDAAAFQTLLRAAAERNAPAAKKKAAARKAASPKTAAKKTSATEGSRPASLLSGGNPQIAKADGDAPVQAYIAAMPGWKRALGEQLDALVVRAVPHVRKAVRWNSPFYGVEGRGWFLSFHVFTRYVKATLFAGAALDPVPPGGTERSKEARWLDVYEDDPFDEALFSSWVKQAAALPGWTP